VLQNKIQIYLILYFICLNTSATLSNCKFNTSQIESKGAEHRDICSKTITVNVRCIAVISHITKDLKSENRKKIKNRLLRSARNDAFSEIRTKLQKSVIASEAQS